MQHKKMKTLLAEGFKWLVSGPLNRHAGAGSGINAGKAKLTAIVLDDVMCFLEGGVIFPTESRGTEGGRKE